MRHILLKTNNFLKMKKLICLLFFLFLFSINTTYASAASFSLNPATKSSEVDSTFSVDLTIDTGGVSTTGTDVIFTYDPTVLEVVDVVDGPNPPYNSLTKTIDNTNGRLNIYASVQSAAYAYSGSTTLATISLKGTATGASTFEFLCTAGSTTDSNITNLNGQDILDCSLLTNGSYTITSASTATNPTATPTTTTTDQTTDEELPESGTTEITILIAAISIALIATGTKMLFAKQT